MQFRKVPKNGDELSILSFGCMRLPMQDGKIDEPQAIEQIHYAIDRGVNYFDTAWPYHAGESETLLGKALADGHRQRVKVATKLPSWLIKSRADMDRFLNAQLAKLGTDCIDYYLLHALGETSWSELAQLGVIDFLDRAQKDGRIANPGFSFHGSLEDFQRIVDAYPWVFCQIQYNYFDEDYQAGRAGLKYAADRGLGVIVMEPLRGGGLVRNIPPAIQAIWDEAPTQRSPADWALRWIWDQPEVTSVLSGMNALSQIDENLAIAESVAVKCLRQDELAIVRRVGCKYRELMKVRCTGCGYCMPCPSGVKIPLCFEEYNKMHLFAAGGEVRFMYSLLLSGLLSDHCPGYASQCTRCNTCLEKCPQQIAIPDVLAQVVAELEGPDLPQRLATVRKMFQIEPK